MRVEVALPLLFAMALGAPSRVARAQGDLVTRAKAEMAQLNYDAAIALLEQAEVSGTNGPAEMVDIYRAAAESHAAMGRTDAAETAFRRLLALDPSVELPAGSSPKLTGPYTGAREFLAKRRIAVECRRGAADAATLVVQSDPVDLVAGARLVTADGAAIGGDVQGQGRVALAIPGGAAAAGCAALDRHGNVLTRAELSATPEESGGAVGGAAGGTGGGDVVGGATPEEDGARPIYARWWLYAGLGAVSASVAVFYGLKMQSAEDDLEALHEETMQAGHDVTYADALEVQDRGEGYARNANIALVVTGVFAAVSGGLLVHQLVTERRRSEGEPAVSAAPLSGGGGAVNLTLGF